MKTTLKKIEGKYHTPVHSRGKTKWISTGSSSKQEAERVVAESGVARLNVAAKAGRLTRKAIGQILTGKNLTCLKALEEYGKAKSTNKAPKTIANNLLVIGNWLKEMRLESTPPSAVTAPQISKWINNPALTWKRSTRQVALASVRTFFEFCANRGWIVADVSQDVELDYDVMSHGQKEQDEKQPFTDEEVKRIIGELRKDWNRAQTDKHELFRDAGDVLFWLVAMSIGKETGLRLSDIAKLEWRSFSDPGVLAVWTGKTNKRIEHPISEAVQHLISEIPVTDADYLFPAQRAIITDVAKRSGLSVQFSRLLEKLGIEGKSFHSLRHFKATHAFAKMDKEKLAAKLAEVLSIDQIAALLGHSDKKTTKGYLH
jgi:integrase